MNRYWQCANLLISYYRRTMTARNNVHCHRSVAYCRLVRNRRALWAISMCKNLVPVKSIPAATVVLAGCIAWHAIWRVNAGCAVTGTATWWELTSQSASINLIYRYRRFQLWLGYFTTTLERCNPYRNTQNLHTFTFASLIPLACIYLLADCRLIVERRFTCPSDPVSYAGGSASSWYSHPCQADQRVGARRSVVPGPSGWMFSVGLTTPSRKYLVLRSHGGGQDPHRGVAPVKNKN
jgi:hypothetical protein